MANLSWILGNCCECSVWKYMSNSGEFKVFNCLLSIAHTGMCLIGLLSTMSDWGVLSHKERRYIVVHDDDCALRSFQEILPNFIGWVKGLESGIYFVFTSFKIFKMYFTLYYFIILSKCDWP